MFPTSSIEKYFNTANGQYLELSVKNINVSDVAGLDKMVAKYRTSTAVGFKKAKKVKIFNNFSEHSLNLNF